MYSDTMVLQNQNESWVGAHPNGSLSRLNTSVVLNHINWCTSYLLTCGISLLGRHPGQLSKTSHHIGTHSVNTKTGVVGIDGGVGHTEEVKDADKLYNPIGLGKMTVNCVTFLTNVLGF